MPRPPLGGRTVLLTSATGFLGRYLALGGWSGWIWSTGKLICLVPRASDTEAAARLDAPPSTAAIRSCSRTAGELADHLEVLVGDRGEENLGLDPTTWARLAADVPT